MLGMASAINRPPLRGFRNCGRGISLGINVQQLDSAVESSHREISEPSLDALGCLVIHFAGKDEKGLAHSKTWRLSARLAPQSPIAPCAASGAIRSLTAGSRSNAGEHPSRCGDRV